MYQVLLVDDEPLILSGIKSLVDWEQLGCQVVDTARNGQQAVEKIRTLLPDIVICDIAMPLLTGTQVLEQIADELPATVFIMLTNHPDFDLAQQSLRFHAVDYLLKSQLDTDMLENSLRRACAQRDDHNRLARVQLVDQYLQTSNQSLLDTALLHLVREQSGACDTAALEPLQQADYLERYAALRIAFDFSPVPNSDAFSAGDIARLYHCHKDLAEKLARNLFAHCVILAPREEADCNALFVFCHHFPETEQWAQTVAAYCTKLKAAGAVITQAQTFVLATDLFSGAQSTECFRKQLFALRDHHYIAEADGLPYSQLPEIAWESLAMNGFFSRLCAELRTKNATAVRLLLERAIERVRAVPHPYSQGLWLCSEVYRAVRTTQSEMPGAEGGTLFSAAGSTVMEQFSTRRQVAYWLAEATNELCSGMEQSGCAKAEMVEKAKQYVQDNIDKRIMLQDVADFVCISPGYLSALFKKVHQQNFVDYLNHVKVERACTLIQAQALRIGEISDRLGFENACYFSRVFKRHTGLTPTEYQKKQRREAAPDQSGFDP